MNRSITFLAVLSLVGLFSAHCQPSVDEGERCNPSLSHNECAGDPAIQCTVPTNCVVAYCCGPKSTSPNCQACAAGDGGTDEGGADAATDSAVDDASDAAPADAAEAG